MLWVAILRALGLAKHLTERRFLERRDAWNRQDCVLTAFSAVPKKRLMRGCCLIHLKNNATCQRHLSNLAMVGGGGARSLAGNTRALPVSG